MSRARTLLRRLSAVWLTVLFQELPTYNEKRRGTISAATLRNLQRSRSNPQLSHLFQSNTSDLASSNVSLPSRRCDTSPVRAVASLSSAYQHHHHTHAGHQHAEPIRSSILSNSGQITAVILTADRYIWFSCGPPIGRITRFAWPSVSPSVCPVQAHNSKTKEPKYWHTRSPRHE